MTATATATATRTIVRQPRALAEGENPFKTANEARKAKVLARVIRSRGGTLETFDVQDSPLLRQFVEEVAAAESAVITSDAPVITEQMKQLDRFLGSSEITWALVRVFLED